MYDDRYHDSLKYAVIITCFDGLMNGLTEDMNKAQQNVAVETMSGIGAGICVHQVV